SAIPSVSTQPRTSARILSSASALELSAINPARSSRFIRFQNGAIFQPHGERYFPWAHRLSCGLQRAESAFIQTPHPLLGNSAGDPFYRVKFTALTFNMQFGQSWDPTDPDNAPVVLDDTIEFISSFDADIIFLQEVEQARPGGEQIWPPPNFMALKHGLTG